MQYRLWLVRCWLLLAGLGAAPRAAAQAVPLQAVSGTVLDAGSRQPLASATVQVKRTRQGVATDAQGNFRLSARPSDTLLVRALGYATQLVRLRATTRPPLLLQVGLPRDSVRLGEVRVTADRADRAAINRALRNMRRPVPVQPRVAVRPRLLPVFPVDSTPPPPPPPGGTPIGWAYEKFSRAGKERAKMKKIKVADAREKAHQQMLRYNKAFRDNRGYE